MPKERFSLTIDSVTHIAQETILSRGGHVPMLLIEGDKNAIALPISDLADTHEGRSNQMFLAGMFLASEGIIGPLQQLFLISEGWLSLKEENKSLEQSPSQDPNRKEVLTISHQNVVDDTTQMRIMEMKRDDSGVLRSIESVGNYTDSETESVESPLLRAFVIGFLGLSQEADD